MCIRDRNRVGGVRGDSCGDPLGAAPLAPWCPCLFERWLQVRPARLGAPQWWSHVRPLRLCPARVCLKTKALSDNAGITNEQEFVAQFSAAAASNDWAVHEALQMNGWLPDMSVGLVKDPG